MNDGFCVESMLRFTGTTVTIFTSSGGASGSGFTGVLAGVCDGCVRLITCIGAPPCCPLGSDCDDEFDFGRGFGWGWGNSWGWGGGRGGFGGCCGGDRNNNLLGSVTNIPICNIVGFVHNAV